MRRVTLRLPDDQPADVIKAFNTELDGMFSDAQLPPTQAFVALQQDLQVTKTERNSLRLENSRLKRELEEANLKREQ
jgi:regulator of replication initiation timing